MARTRITTTVDETILNKARSLNDGVNDATLIDQALNALIASNRTSEIDKTHSAYDEYPIDTEDDWVNLQSFREAAAKS